MKRTSGLPDFEQPPLVEVALSVQFEPVGLLSKHMALLWEKCRVAFPLWQDQPPIPPAFELFDAACVSAQFSTVPLIRAVFKNVAGTELKQYQGDRFVRNWTRSDAAPVYPRYENIREPFAADFRELAVFMAEHSLGRLLPNQCEVTYVNLIPLPTHTTEGLSEIISPWTGTYSDAFLSAPEAMELALHFPLLGSSSEPEPVGRLHLHAGVVGERGVPQRSLQLTLTARGQPFSSDLNGVLEFLDLGREHIVKGFTSFTTSKMHGSWRRRDGSS